MEWGALDKAIMGYTHVCEQSLHGLIIGFTKPFLACMEKRIDHMGCKEKFEGWCENSKLKMMIPISLSFPYIYNK